MPRLRSALDDARHALRSLRRSPGFTAASLLTLAFGSGVGLPLLLAARAGMAVVPPPEAPGFARMPGAGGGWTDALYTAAEMRQEGLRGALLVVLGAALLVLAGTCVNVTALALARASARRHETAMRAVLGAPPRRLVTGALAELGLLTAGGAGAGVMVGLVVLGVLRATWPGGAGEWLSAAPDRAVLAAAALPVVVLLAGLVPVLRASRDRLADELAVGSRATAGRHEGWVRRVITVAQFAGSMMLLVGAGVLIRGSGADARAAGPGFDPRDTLTLRLDPPAALRGNPEKLAAFYAAAAARARRLAGVRSVSVASPGAWLGLGPRDRVTTFCNECREGGLSAPVIQRPARHHAVNAGYFGALGVPVADGRAPRPGAREVVMNRAAASTLFPGGNPLGKKMMLSTDISPAAALIPGYDDGRPKAERYTVIGVVGDVQPSGLGSPAGAVPALYLPAALHPPATAAIAVRTSGDPRNLASAVSAALLTGAPGARVAQVATMEETLARHRAPLAWIGAVLAALAAFAVVLCSSGVYAVVAFGVARRTREIGVRMALGARQGQVVRHVVGGGMRMARTGALLGLLGAIGMARTLQVYFRGVDPADVIVYAGVTLLLAAVSLAASWIPARRAARVDPMVALQSG